MRALMASGIEALDRDMGGIPAGCLVEVYGASAAGKSTMALAVARANAPCALVLSENPHPDRVREVLGPAMRSCVIARPADLAKQDALVHEAAAMLVAGKVRAIVLDSLVFHYRFERLSSMDALRTLFGQLRELRAAARASGGLALFTNQVLQASGGPRPVGGHGVAHASDIVLGLDVLDGPWRRLRLEKHPVEPAGSCWDVRLGRDGFEPLP